MGKKKDDNVLALAPLASDFGTATNTSLVAGSSLRALTKDEKRMIEHVQSQQLAIRVIGAKAQAGASMIGEIHEHASTTFDETTSFIVEIKDRSGRSQQHQAYVDQFSERQIQLLAQHLLGVVDVSATSIGVEIHRTVWPPPERRAGFLQRLFGSEE